MSTVPLYALFAAICIGINIATQAITFSMMGGAAAVPASILFGTAAGLVSKYLLDKRWIFEYTSQNTSEEASTFSRYAMTGVISTAIFWGTEYAFHITFSSDPLRYLGGVMGLIAGYIVKYRLDKRYVFQTPARCARTNEPSRPGALSSTGKSPIESPLRKEV